MKRNNMKSIILIVILQLIGEIQGLVTWDNCIGNTSDRCPSECIQAGYVRNRLTSQCNPPPYTFCFGTIGVCDPTQPSNFLQACLDYGFTNDAITGQCIPPKCIKNNKPCPTTTTYCQDQGYTISQGLYGVIAGACECVSPFMDNLGTCNYVLSSPLSQFFVSLLVSLVLLF